MVYIINHSCLLTLNFIQKFRKKLFLRYNVECSESRILQISCICDAVCDHTGMPKNRRIFCQRRCGGFDTFFPITFLPRRRWISTITSDFLHWSDDTMEKNNMQQVTETISWQAAEKYSWQAAMNSALE